MNQLALELDINSAVDNIRDVVLELLNCERVTLFLVDNQQKELRYTSAHTAGSSSSSSSSDSRVCASQPPYPQPVATVYTCRAQAACTNAVKHSACNFTLAWLWELVVHSDSASHAELAG